MFCGVLDNPREIIIFEASIGIAFQTARVKFSVPRTEPLLMALPVEFPFLNIVRWNHVLVGRQLEILDSDLSPISQ